MARATFVKKAQKDIYQTGKIVSYVSQKGKREGQTLTKRDRTIPADENDKVFIAKGESYYHWAFQYGPTHYSKTPPKASQLTQSNYLSTLYSIQEEIAEWAPGSAEEVAEGVDAFKTQLEELRDTCQESLDNMPESLQSAPTGELLQERIDSLENAISEFENIDTDRDEIEGEATDEQNEELQEWIDEKVGEVQDICFD